MQKTNTIKADFGCSAVLRERPCLAKRPGYECQLPVFLILSILTFKCPVLQPKKSLPHHYRWA
jgi:hypothetical protein